MVGVIDGTMDLAQADAVIKAAKQINASMREETKRMKVRSERGEAFVEFGSEKLPGTDRGGRPAV